MHRIRENLRALFYFCLILLDRNATPLLLRHIRLLFRNGLFAVHQRVIAVLNLIARPAALAHQLGNHGPIAPIILHKPAQLSVLYKGPFLLTPLSELLVVVLVALFRGATGEFLGNLRPADL